MTFIQNAWYVAAQSRDVSAQTPLARWVIDQPLVLFRDGKGAPFALADTCPHRMAPLSMGVLSDGCIQCPYHGLRFDSAGACINNPHGDGRIPDRAKVRSYPAVEKYGVIWVWMGAADSADPAVVPHFPFMDDSEFYVAMGEMVIDGNYQLENDNILDLSHIEFVHPMFSSPAVSAGVVSHEIDGEIVWSRRDIHNDEHPPQFIREVFHVPEGPVDRWLYVSWQAPSYLSLEAGGMAVGAAREQAMTSMQVHWFTPETHQRTRYYYGNSLPKFVGPEGQAIVNSSCAALRPPFEFEDKPLVEAQQMRIGDRNLLHENPIVLNIDAAGMAARRLIQLRLEQEAQSLGDAQI
jgi:phenylpropionate dioxygenase-like ring-hydroxylating dioxygenase large terminal subunit